MVYNGAGIYQSANADWFDNQTVDQMNRWQNPGDITDVPQARLDDGNGVKASSRYLSDGSYIRIRSINLGYNLPTSLVIKNEDVFTSGCMQAFRTSTPSPITRDGTPKLTTPVPTVHTQNTNIIQGYDFYTAPQARTYTLGINLSF